MKRNSIATSSLVVLSLLLTAAGAYAQSAVKATVPFAFQAGRAQVPAGTYIMQRQSDTHLVVIRNLKTQAVVFALSSTQAPSTKVEKMVFHHVGGQYTLTEICGTEGSPTLAFSGAPSRALKTHREVETASRPSSGGETVEIALNK